MAPALVVFCAWIGAAQRPDQQPVPPAFESGVRMLEVDARVFDTIACYLLGYQPAKQECDGKDREIEVRVNRPSGHVRARKGCLALPPSKMLIPKPIR